MGYLISAVAACSLLLSVYSSIGLSDHIIDQVRMDFPYLYSLFSCFPANAGTRLADMRWCATTLLAWIPHVVQLVSDSISAMMAPELEGGSACTMNVSILHTMQRYNIAAMVRKRAVVADQLRTNEVQ